MGTIRGVYSILSTPFNTGGELDPSSLRRLVDETIKAGVDGITILGVAGEAQKLTNKERQTVLNVTMEITSGRLPIIVGTSHDGTDATIIASLEAEQAGAAGIMVAPPTFLQPGPVLTEHYRRIASAVSLPIVLQDYPPLNGVTLSPQAMSELANAIPAITTIKLEDTPTPLRIAQTFALLGDRLVSIVGGIGAVYFLDELRRGSHGTMTGFAFPEILVAMWRCWQTGERQTASEIYARYLPLLVFEGQPKIGLAVRKELLRLRGLIASGSVRFPGPALDISLRADLEETLALLDLHAPFENLQFVLNALHATS